MRRSSTRARTRCCGSGRTSAAVQRHRCSATRRRTTSRSTSGSPCSRTSRATPGRRPAGRQRLGSARPAGARRARTPPRTTTRRRSPLPPTARSATGCRCPTRRCPCRASPAGSAGRRGASPSRGSAGGRSAPTRCGPRMSRVTAELRDASVSVPSGDEQALGRRTTSRRSSDAPRTVGRARARRTTWRSPSRPSRNGAFATTSTPAQQGYDGDGLGVIAKFLQVKAGYCIHFASTMAVMARIEGIPARIVVGDQPGVTPARPPPAAPSRATICTPGRSCTSTASAGSGSSRHPAVAACPAPRRPRPRT